MIKVTAALLVIDDMLLIAKRKPTARLPNLWELPGGKIEVNETPEECLKREIMEEFDIDIKVGEYLGSNVYGYDFGTIELMLYRAIWEDGDLILRDHEEIRWVFPHELDQFDFAPADRSFVDKLRRGVIEI
ncbi:MAG: (deoxy)nucleoside triphosphate pyrophosphohydrolase [Deltaproteobacteria bacterium]|nr:(deoxy)nucleoside triphosphate pyrophosphohydrolase [Deltaproteobacteria bacterium]